MPRNPSDLDHRQRRSVGQNNCHLQEGLDLQTQVVGSGLGKGLCAVTAGEHKSFTARGRAQSGAQIIYFTGENQGWLATELSKNRAKRILIRIRGLLKCPSQTPCFPRRGVFVSRGCKEVRCAASREVNHG